MSRRDLRLVWPAGAAWAAALGCLLGLGLVSPASDRRLGAAVVLVGAAVLAATAVVVLARGRVVLGVVLLSAAAGATGAALHVSTLAADPVAGWAEQGAVVRAVVRVEGDPRVSTGRTSGSWRRPDAVTLRGRLQAGTARGATVTTSVPVQLRLDAGAPAPPDGARILVSGRLSPGRPAWETAASLSVVGAPQVIEAPGTVAAAATAVRIGLRTALADRDPDAAALVAGLAVGDESGQSADLAEAMRASGLSHLTAVSGGNVAIVLLAVLAVARAVGLRRRGRVVVAVAALAGFVVLVRPQPSVLRAAAMGAVAVLAVAVGGRRRAIPALAGAVLVLVVTTPVLAASYGFALSVAATAGLVLVAEPLRVRLGRWGPTARWPPALLDAAAVTLAAQLATAPLVAALGGGIGLAAVPANLLAAPAVAPVTVLGLVAALLSPVLPGPASVLAAAAALPAGWIAGVAYRCAALPLATLPWPDGAAGGLALAAVAAIVAATVLVWRRRGWRVPAAATRRAAGLVCLVAGVLLALRSPADAGWPPQGWQVVACDVGQGDAVVVRTGDSRAVVVDAGPDPDVVAACLDDLGVREVAALVLTHFHADHVEGVPGVLRGRSVGAVLASPLAEPAEERARVAAWLAPSGRTLEAVTAGDHRSDGEVSWRVLWPRRLIRGAESAPNNASLVLLVDTPDLRLLLTGDVEPAAQVALAGAEPFPDADVVKIPHHGSRYQAPGFAAWTGAEVALVSLGADNDYGHPAPETLAAYAGLGALVARTDERGDLAVVVTADGRPGLVTRR